MCVILTQRGMFILCVCGWDTHFMRWHINKISIWILISFHFLKRLSSNTNSFIALFFKLPQLCRHLSQLNLIYWKYFHLNLMQINCRTFCCYLLSDIPIRKYLFYLCLRERERHLRAVNSVPYQLVALNKTFFFVGGDDITGACSR